MAPIIRGMPNESDWLWDGVSLTEINENRAESTERDQTSRIVYVKGDLSLLSPPHECIVTNGRIMIKSFLTVDDTRSFCGQYRSRSNCTERAVRS